MQDDRNYPMVGSLFISKSHVIPRTQPSGPYGTLPFRRFTKTHIATQRVPLDPCIFCCMFSISLNESILEAFNVYTFCTNWNVLFCKPVSIFSGSLSQTYHVTPCVRIFQALKFTHFFKQTTKTALHVLSKYPQGTREKQLNAKQTQLDMRPRTPYNVDIFENSVNDCISK